MSKKKEKALTIPSITLQSNYCCGVRELDGLEEMRGRRDPKEFLIAVIGQMGGWKVDYSKPLNDSVYYWNRQYAKVKSEKLHPGCAHVLFTQAGSRSKYGERFRDFIVSANLGKVIESDGKVNPNSRRSVRAFLWSPDKAALEKWWKSQDIDIDKLPSPGY